MMYDDNRNILLFMKWKVTDSLVTAFHVSGMLLYVRHTVSQLLLVALLEMCVGRMLSLCCCWYRLQKCSRSVAAMQVQLPLTRSLPWAAGTPMPSWYVTHLCLKFTAVCCKHLTMRLLAVG